jgi:uncharacterized protein (DUF58 family)
MRPTSDAVAIGVLAALLLIVATNLQAGWVYAVDALLIGLLAVSGLSARFSLRGLIVDRLMPLEVFDGDTLTIRLRVAVRRGRGYFIELRDTVPGVTPQMVVLPTCDARHPVTLTYAARAERRGVGRVDSIDARASGLAGLFVARRRVAAPGTITVFPRYWALTGFQVPRRDGAETTSFPRQSRDGQEPAGVREFRDGDSLRHVHWRSTARRGTLVVREFEHEASDPVTVLLDTRLELYAADQSGQAFEDLVRAAASIVHAVSRSGRPVQLLGASGTEALHAVAGWVSALHWLARIQADGRLTPAEVYSATVAPGTPVVLCSADADAAAALAQRGIPLSVVLVDVASYAESRSQGVAIEMLLQALGVRSAVLRKGEEGGACLAWLER